MEDISKIVHSPTKGYLKNLEKYNKLKLAQGVFLDNAQIDYRQDDYTGVSTGDFGFFWYMLPKGKAIFKTYTGGDELEAIQNIRIVNELLCYELSKQVGIRCAEYELAEYQGQKGVISYNVSAINEKLTPATEVFDKFNLPPYNEFRFYLKAQERLEDLNYSFDKHKMILDLYKISLFDFLTVQSDRHRNNIFMLINRKNKTVKIAPIIDNEFAFNGLYFDTMVWKDKGTITQKTFAEKTSAISKTLLIKENSYYDNNVFLSNAKHLVNLAKYNPEMGEIFKTFVSNYNIQKAIESLEQKGVEINSEYKEFLLMTEQYVKQVLKNELNKTEQIEKKEDYDFML